MSRLNPLVRTTVFRTYAVSEGLRDAVRAKRQALGVTLRRFLERAAEELPGLVQEIRQLNLPVAATDTRPMRLPLPDKLLAELAEASAKTGLPANRLLLAVMGRAAGRERRLRKLPEGVDREALPKRRKSAGRGLAARYLRRPAAGDRITVG